MQLPLLPCCSTRQTGLLALQFSLIPSIIGVMGIEWIMEAATSNWLSSHFPCSQLWLCDLFWWLVYEWTWPSAILALLLACECCHLRICYGEPGNHPDRKATRPQSQSHKPTWWWQNTQMGRTWCRWCCRATRTNQEPSTFKHKTWKTIKSHHLSHCSLALLSEACYCCLMTCFCLLRFYSLSRIPVLANPSLHPVLQAYHSLLQTQQTFARFNSPATFSFRNSARTNNSWFPTGLFSKDLFT